MNNQEKEYQGIGEGLALFGAYCLTGIIGFPLLLAGILLHQKKMGLAWQKMAYTVAALYLEKELSPKAGVGQSKGKPLEVIDYFQASLDANHLLSINRVDGMYTRVVMHTADGGIRSRIDLTDIFEGELCLFGLEESLPSAMTYTIQQIDNGVHSDKLQFLRRTSKATPGANAPKSERPNKPEPEPTVEPKATPKQSSQAEPKGTGRSTDRRQQKAKGAVTFVGNRVVNVPGQRAYETFAVVLTDNSREFTFSGVDLAEQYDEGVFAKGDFVEITPLGKVSFTVDQDGKSESRTKNKFDVRKFH